MQKVQVARKAMLVRVRLFGKKYEVEFPADSIAGRAFAIIAVILGELDGLSEVQQRSIGEGQRVRKLARQVLVRRLDAVTRTARAIGQEQPGFDNPFRLSRPMTDHVLLTSAAVFAGEAQAEAAKAAFIARKLPPTFIEDLRAAAAQLQAAIETCNTATRERTQASVGIQAAFDKAAPVLRELDAIVRNHFAGDPDVLGAWEQLRHVTRPRTRGSDTPADPGTTPATPAATDAEMKKAS